MISIVIIVKHDRKINILLKKLRLVKKPEKTEIIVVDASDGSLNDIKKQHESITWIEFKNIAGKSISIPEQRNLGVKKAKGDTIVFIDADCVPYENWLTELLKPIVKENEMMVAGKVIVSDSNSILAINSAKLEKIKYVNEAPTMNLAVRKEVFETVGLFDTNFSIGEDVDFCWRASKLGYRIRIVSSAKIYHDLGTFQHEVNRMFRYGIARIRLYKKHAYRRKFLIDELTIVLYSVYFLFLPLTLIFPYYPLLGVLFIRKNKDIKSFIKNILLKSVFGLGMLKELILPVKLN